jgi:PDZ domain
VIAAGSVAIGAMPMALRAAEPTTRPALQELNDETTALYQQVDAGMVHVEIPRSLPVVHPAPPPLPAPQPPILPPAPDPNQSPSTRPAGSDPTGDAGQQESTKLPSPLVNLIAPPGVNITVTAQSSNGSTVTVVRSKMEVAPPPSQPPPGEVAGNAVLGARLRAAMTVPSNIGILLDDQGHVLVPIFIDRPMDGQPPLRVAGPDGSLQSARFVGSDRQTNLTVLQVYKPVGTPLKWTGDRPAKGSLVMYISPGDGSGRLGIWTGGASDFGVVVSIDGHIDGIARFGQFLNGSACQLIAKQLVLFGMVKRASLGIFISEIQPNDPLRNQLPGLGSRPAMRVLNVITGSSADKAGLQAGDLVLELAGQPVNDIPSFAAAIAARSGHTPMQILRGDKTMTLTADLQPN